MTTKVEVLLAFAFVFVFQLVGQAEAAAIDSLSRTVTAERLRSGNVVTGGTTTSTNEGLFSETQDFSFGSRTGTSTQLSTATASPMSLEASGSGSVSTSRPTTAGSSSGSRGRSILDIVFTPETNASYTLTGVVLDAMTANGNAAAASSLLFEEVGGDSYLFTNAPAMFSDSGTLTAGVTYHLLVTASVDQAQVFPPLTYNANADWTFNLAVQEIPEPSGLTISLLGCAALVARRRWRRLNLS